MTKNLLLIDPRSLAATVNAREVLGEVEKCAANPLLVEEGCANPPKAWEARLDNVYPSVIHDEDDGLFKCWYKSFIIDEASGATPLSQRPQRAYFGGQREEGVLYAVSADGIQWQKPNLGIIEFNGSRDNNIVMRRATHGIHAGGVLKDPVECDPARRYKFIHRNPRAGRMASCFSADGIRWSQPQIWTRHDAVGDTHNNAIWSPELERYVCITRGWSDGAFRGLRTVLRSESRDFVHWTQPLEILRGAHAHDQIYSMPIARYGSLYIGLPAVFHKGDAAAPDWDTVDTELALSVDSVTWQRVCPGQALIPRGAGAYPDGDHDCGCVYAAAPFVRGDKVLIYYGGSNGLHNNWREGSLNLAILALDRFAGYAPHDDSATAFLTTVPLRLTGREIGVNANVGAGGWLRAAALDAGGSPLDGFDMDDCQPIQMDDTAHALRWRDASIESLAGKAFTLAMELRGGVVYALGGLTTAVRG